MAAALQHTGEMLRDGLCQLAMEYQDEELQSELQALRACAGSSFYVRLRELLLPVQMRVLRGLGMPEGAEGLAQLEAAVQQHAEAGDLELLRMANAALKVVKVPPIACKVRDATYAALWGLRRKEIGPPQDPVLLLHNNGERRDFWRSLCPWLHVGDADFLQAAQDAISPCEAAAARHDLIDEGYFAFQPSRVYWDVNVAGVARGVETLVALGLPAVLILMYDEPWVMAAQLGRLLESAAPGAELLFDWWAFLVPPGSSRGGPPRRDRSLGESQAGGFDADGTPQYTAFWVPLTASSPDSACLMAVPRARDPGYTDGDGEASAIRTILRSPVDFQYIRALPVAEGGLVGFSHRVCHWYSACDPRAATSGAALIFTAADPAFELPCLRDSDVSTPNLGLRLALVAAQALRSPRGEQVVTSRARLQLFWELFVRREGAFRPNFCQQLSQLRASQERAFLEPTSAETCVVKEERGAHLKFEESMFEVTEAQRGQEDQVADPAALRLPSLSFDVDPLEILQSRHATRDSPAFWLKLCPWLHCGDAQMAAAARDKIFRYAEDWRLQEEGSTLKEHLIREGFFSIEGGRLPWAVDLAGMARGIMTLVDRGFPPIFILAYDEPWVMSAQMQQLSWITTGGNEVAFDWSAFCVRAASSATGERPEDGGGAGKSVVTPSGWPPHRDRASNKSAVNGFREDGTPRYLTLWVPMTDATPQSSCLCIVPRRRDPGYRWGDWGGSEISYIFRKPEDFQYVRAMPLATGGVLAFNHRLFHWGTAADPRAAAPRVSMAFTATDPGFERPCFLHPGAVLPMPSLGLRMALAGAQSLRYYGNDQIVTSMNRLRLFWSMFEEEQRNFMPGFVSEVEHYNQKKFQLLEQNDREMLL